ncbi:flagellar biosynthetic protein FliQ [Burkholderia sp. SR8]|uniref:flagellar biosynthetic protein FliQ n=1 Tax=Burkholderia sp. SR8 TaxID=3062277 RepID=UPI0040632ACE
MTSSTILDLTRQALMLVLLLSLPIVLIATVTGLVVALVLLSGWLGSEVLRFAQQALERMFVSSTGVF